MSVKRSQEPAYLVLNRLSQCQTDLTRNVRIPESEKSPALTKLAQEQRRIASRLIGDAMASIAKCMELVETIEQIEEFNHGREPADDHPSAGTSAQAARIDFDQDGGTHPIARTGEALARGLEESDARGLQNDAPGDRAENEGNQSP